MYTKRIIPCLDVKDGRVVKGINFESIRDAGDPVEAAETYSKAGADELVFLDITASSDSRDIVIDMVRRVAEKVFIPFTVGGGIRSIDDFRRVLRAGADKIAVNTYGFLHPEIIKEASDYFGSQCVVAAIDVKRRTDREGWEVYINGGRTPTGKDAAKYAKEVEALGAGEILLTSMDCDGVKNGYDLEITEIVSSSAGIPVIASGGAGSKEDFLEVLTKGKADAALAASLFHYRELEIKDLKNYLRSSGIEVRL